MTYSNETLCLTILAVHALNPTCCERTGPKCPAEHQYKAIVAIYKPMRGLHVHSSPDAIHWRI
jgi:hypothetical protein